MGGRWHGCSEADRRLGVGSIRPESVSGLEREPPARAPPPTDSAGTAALVSPIEVNALTSGRLSQLFFFFFFLKYIYFYIAVAALAFL